MSNQCQFDEYCKLLSFGGQFLNCGSHFENNNHFEIENSHMNFFIFLN